MNSILGYILLCSYILSTLAAENKSVSEKAENKDATVKKTDLIAEETRRQSTSYKPPLRNIPNPESEYGLVDEYPPGPVGPAGHSSGYGGSPGGYPSPHISGGYDSAYPSNGYSGSRGCPTCGPSPSLSGYDAAYSSGGYGPPSNGYSSPYSPNDYGPSSHASNGYGSQPPLSSGYGSSYSPGGYDSPHSPAGYGGAYSPGSYGAPSPPSSSHTTSHTSSGPSSYSPGNYNSYPSNGYGSSNPQRGYGSSYSPGGYSNSPSRGYGQSHSPNRYNHSPSSHGYRGLPTGSYNPAQPSSGYAEYGPESYRPEVPDYSPPPRSLPGGGHLKIGSSATGGGNANYPSNTYSNGRSKPQSPYGSRDSYSKSSLSPGYDRKYSSSSDRYSRPFRSADRTYGNTYESKDHKQSTRHPGYIKAPLTSGKYSKSTRGYDNSDKYEEYDASPRDRNYDKSADYRKPLRSTGSIDDSYGSYSKPRSYSKATSSKPSRSYSFSKSTSGNSYTKSRDEYDDFDKDPKSYISDSESQGDDKSEEHSSKPKSRYAGYKKHPGKAGASQFDGGYGGYATGPPARGYGDLNKNGIIGSLIGNVGNQQFRPSPPLLSGNTFSQPDTSFGRGFGQMPQNGFGNTYDRYLGNTGTSNFNGFGLGSDVFSRRSLIGDHGLYGAASYGRNYGVSSYDDLENKEYRSDQSIYGGYSHLY